MLSWKTMVEYRERHNRIVNRLSKELNAKTFTHAPFNLLTTNGNFIEVKSCEGKRPKFKISEDELKMISVFPDKYFIYFQYHRKLSKINGKDVLEWASHLSWEKRFMNGKSRQKSIELTNKRKI
jgi:hypothetical protein